MKTQTNKKGAKRAKKNESLEERVHRHLQDINSEISDEDIRNVKTELEVRGETNPGSTTKSEEQEDENSILPTENKDEKKQITPWDLLSDDFE